MRIKVKIKFFHRIIKLVLLMCLLQNKFFCAEEQKKSLGAKLYNISKKILPLRGAGHGCYNIFQMFFGPLSDVHAASTLYRFEWINKICLCISVISVGGLTALLWYNIKKEKLIFDQSQVDFLIAHEKKTYLAMGFILLHVFNFTDCILEP